MPKLPQTETLSVSFHPTPCKVLLTRGEVGTIVIVKPHFITLNRAVAAAKSCQTQPTSSYSEIHVICPRLNESIRHSRGYCTVCAGRQRDGIRNLSTGGGRDDVNEIF
jgi:hypothetical protein